MSKLNKSEVALSILLAMLANPSIRPSDSIVDTCLEAADKLLASEVKENPQNPKKYSIILTQESSEQEVSGWMTNSLLKIFAGGPISKFKLSIEPAE